MQSGAGPCRSTGTPARLIQNVVKPNALAPIASQQFDDTKPMRERRQSQLVDRELVDARTWLVDPGSVDRKNAVDEPSSP